VHILSFRSDVGAYFARICPEAPLQWHPEDQAWRRMFCGSTFAGHRLRLSLRITVFEVVEMAVSEARERKENSRTAEAGVLDQVRAGGVQTTRPLTGMKITNSPSKPNHGSYSIPSPFVVFGEKDAAGAQISWSPSPAVSVASISS